MGEIIPSVPFRVEIEVINKCSTHCDYCYAMDKLPIENGSFKFGFDGYVPPKEQVLYIIDKTEREVHPFDVVFLGGEPFLRQDMIEILEHAYSTFTSAKASVSSNGFHFRKMSDTDLDRLRDLTGDSSMIQVSIDSATNEKIGKGKRSFEGAHVLNSNRIGFRAGIVFTKQNYNDYLNTISLLLQLPYLRGLNLEPLQKTTDEYYNSNVLTEGQLFEIRENVIDLIKKSDRPDVKIIGIKEYGSCEVQKRILDRTPDDLEVRSSMIVNSGVLARGNVCMNGALGRQRLVGNLLRQDWKDIWSVAKELYRGDMRNEAAKQKSYNAKQ
jgi:MoaA/NifB/PqqE/SkfB family radical SAM enzyme